MREVRELFALFDLNGDGSISKRELNTVLKSLGGYPSEETINKMMIEYDDDGNEVIDFDEFIKMIVKYNQELHEDPAKELRTAFEVFDKDQSGTFDMLQLTNMLTMGPEAVDAEEVSQFLCFLQVGGIKHETTSMDHLLRTLLPVSVVAK